MNLMRRGFNCVCTNKYAEAIHVRFILIHNTSLVDVLNLHTIIIFLVPFTSPGVMKTGDVSCGNMPRCARLSL